jgi:hypothetical protein
MTLPDQPSRLPAPGPTAPLIDREPVLVFLGGLAGLANLGLIVATTLDWLALTAGQTTAIVAFVTAGTALVTATLRARVWAPATVAALRAGKL